MGIEKYENDKYLKEIYDKYNKKYFNNELPKDTVVRWSKRMVEGAGNCKELDDNKYLIQLGENYHNIYVSEIQDTLIHEMIHIQNPGHGMGFKKEMNRLNKDYGFEIAVNAKELPRFAYKYILKCVECGYEYRHMRNCKSVREYDIYKCGCCGGKLERIK